MCDVRAGLPAWSSSLILRNIRTILQNRILQNSSEQFLRTSRRDVAVLTHPSIPSSGLFQNPGWDVAERVCTWTCGRMAACMCSHGLPVPVTPLKIRPLREEALLARGYGTSPTPSYPRPAKQTMTQHIKIMRQCNEHDAVQDMTQYRTRAHVTAQHVAAQYKRVRAEHHGR